MTDIIISTAANLLMQTGFDLLLLLGAKYLYEESIKTDRINIILILADIIITGISFTPAYLEMKSHIVFDIITYGIILTVFIRGSRKRILHRIRAMIEMSLEYILTIPVFCSIIYALLNHRLTLDADSEISLDFIFEGTYKIYATGICFILLAYVYTQLVRKRICLNLRWKTRTVLFVFCMFIFLSCSLLMYMSADEIINETPEELKAILAVSLTLIYIVFPAFIIKTQMAANFEAGQNHHQEMLELETKHFQQYRETQEETRRFRHDIINNLLTVQMLQNEGKHDEASRYINELLGRVSELSPKVVTGSDMLDTIMSSKIETMEQSGISVNIDGVFDQGLNMKSIDMCNVFANALDNAIEACEKTEGNRSFEMRIKRNASFYVVSMKNTMAGDETRRKLIGISRFTTKENKAFHGYGLENIRKTVEKYGGETSVSVENDLFLLNILLPVA